MDNFTELLDTLRQQEETIQFTQFTNTMALKLGTLFIEAAAKENNAITIDICRHGQQLFHYAMPGTSADNDEWIKRKNRVVNRFGHSSYYMGIYYANMGTTIQEKALLDPREYAPHGGAFPLLIKNVGVIGTITVSGLPQKEDHELVIAVLQHFLLNQPYA